MLHPPVHSLDDVILKLNMRERRQATRMLQVWPVRHHVRSRKNGRLNHPLLTGQRIIDALFPSVLGGTTCIPGAFALW
ncbi:V-type proton ATPase catalytic subunit A [Lucilia cuprina]|nr:V-type proton ATPase catalytic subunit A [Lucilia cuprina]